MKVTIKTFAIILLIAAATSMSNAAHNYPPIKSGSYLSLIVKLIRRHIIAGPVSCILLFMVPKMIGSLGIIIDLIFIVASMIWIINNVKVTRQQQRYIKSLKPNYPCQWTRVWLDPETNYKLGGTTIHYMLIGPKTKVITFPESKYKNNRKYHLLKLKFQPKYGPNYERLTYVGKPFTRKSLFNDPKTNGKSFTEIPTVATATLESIENSKKIRLRLYNEISSRVARLKNEIYQSNIKPI